MSEAKYFNMHEHQEQEVEISEDALIARYLKLYAGTISDVLDGLGYKNQVLPKELTGLTSDAKFCGTALTVAGEATDIADPDTIFIPILEMLGDVKKNNVVITQPNDDTCSHLGELSATTIQVRGGNGAVIYGGVRDVDYIHRLGLPVYKRYTTPKDVVGRWLLTAYNVPIDIKNVKIFPMDIIFADKDGVVVVPRDLAIKVLLKSEELQYTENHVRNDVMKGVHPVTAYKRHGWF
ncbi:MAG: RraA family protein [Candidatus Fimivivens sp.]